LDQLLIRQREINLDAARDRLRTAREMADIRGVDAAVQTAANLVRQEEAAVADAEQLLLGARAAAQSDAERCSRQRIDEYRTRDETYHSFFGR
jgi:hypothetical protein